jgi:hypothetical protein
MKNIFRLLAFFLLSISFDIQATESAYTSLEEKPCKILASNTEQDYFISSCPGRDGYQIQVAGGDSRSWFIILKNKHTLYDSLNDISEHATGNFANLTDKVLEWRYDNAHQLIALIVRINTQDSDDIQKNISDLFVFRHDKGRFCYAGSHKTNEGARELADTQIGFCKP